MGQPPVGEGQAGLPQSHVPQAIPPVGRVLWHLPQSSLPVELNGYKWLRGQNHYDAFRLSGVSGHGITSFYYPPKAQTNCNGCHMPAEETGPGVNFGADDFAGDGRSLVHNHQFLGGQHGHLASQPRQMPDADAAIEAHREFNEGVMRWTSLVFVKKAELTES